MISAQLGMKYCVLKLRFKVKPPAVTMVLSTVMVLDFPNCVPVITSPTSMPVA